MMNNQIIVYCVVALLLGMLLANMLKSVCGCKVDVIEGMVYTAEQINAKNWCGAVVPTNSRKGGPRGEDGQYLPVASLIHHSQSGDILTPGRIYNYEGTEQLDGREGAVRVRECRTNKTQDNCEENQCYWDAIGRRNAIMSSMAVGGGGGSMGEALNKIR
jgi:hypothetical protein